MSKILYTRDVPQCPYCKKPTVRSGGSGSSTLMYFPPRYDESGKNVNPDRNIHTSHWHCEECDKNYTVSGNTVDGFEYTLDE